MKSRLPDTPMKPRAPVAAARRSPATTMAMMYRMMAASPQSAATVSLNPQSTPSCVAPSLAQYASSTSTGASTMNDRMPSTVREVSCTTAAPNFSHAALAPLNTRVNRQGRKCGCVGWRWWYVLRPHHSRNVAMAMNTPGTANAQLYPMLCLIHGITRKAKNEPRLMDQ